MGTVDIPNLTPRQEAFVREYLVDLNGTQAAIRAGYSEASAASQASDLLRNPKVAAAVAAAREERAGRLEVTADRIVRELARVAFADYSTAFDESGALKKPHEMPENVRAALAGMDYAKTGERIGRFSDKTRCLELLGKHMGMFKEKLEHSGPERGALSITIDIGGGES